MKIKPIFLNHSYPKIIKIFLIFIFFFNLQVHSVFAEETSVISNNLLNGISVKSIDQIDYTISSLPTNTSVTIQFSTDNTNWYNKSKSTGSETLAVGSNSIPLTNFGTSAFYYKITFTSTNVNGDTPLLDSLNLRYTAINNDLFSWQPWAPDTNETVIHAFETAGTWSAPESIYSQPTFAGVSLPKTQGNNSVKITSTTDGKDNISKIWTTGLVGVVDLSSVNTFQYDIASNKPGTYLQTTLQENASDFANYVADSNTVAFWHFYDGNIVDSSSNNLSVTNTETTSVQGKLGLGRHFDGVDDRILVSSSVFTSIFNSNASADFTVDAWVKPNSFPNYQGIFGQPKDTGYAFWISYTGSLGFRIDDGTVLYSSVSLNQGSWNHVAITYNGSTKLMSVYVNGQPAGTATNTDTAITTSNNVYIGKETLHNIVLDGDIDEVRVSNVVRSATDILASYEIGKRTHTVTIDFAASLGKNASITEAENLIADSSDLAFYIDESPYGSSNLANHLFDGDKIIVQESTYLAQGTVRSVDKNTGYIEVLSWDSGSTFPVGGFTADATVFKWQTEFINLNDVTDTDIDAVNTMILKINGGTTARDIYLDNVRYSSGYLTNNASSAFILPPNNQFLQYRAILTSHDDSTTPSLSEVNIGYTSNAPDVPTISTASATATSISWTVLDDVSGKAQGFSLYDLDNNQTSTSSGTGVITETGLTPNTQYSRKAYGWNGYGRSQKSNEYSQYTLSAVPDLTFVRNDSHATVSAIANNNPSNTKYSIVLNSGTQTDCNLDPDSLTLPDPYYVSQTGSLTTTEANKGWFTSTELSNLVVSGLNNISVYSMCLKSRNEDLIETDYSTAYSNNGNYRPILGDIIVDEGVGNTVGFANYYTDCNDPSRIVFGSDTTDANSNTSRFELRTGVLTLQSNESLIAGELVLGDGSSIAFGEPVATVSGIVNGAQIILGGRITQTDADGDGYPEDPSVLCYTTKSNTTLDPTVKLIGQIPNRDVADCDDQSDSLNTVCTTVYLDADRDGKGAGSGTNNCNPDPVTLSCEYGGDQYVTNNTDCNDSESTLSTPLSCYLDSDGDEYGSGTADNYCVETGLSCQGTSTYSAPTNGAAVTTGELSNINTDCYDSSENAYPSSTYCSSTDRGDGSFDYNCSSSETACGTIYSLIQTTANTGGCVGDSCRSYTKTVYSTGSTSCGSTGYGSCTGSTTYCVDCDVNGGVCGCSKSKSFCTSATSGTQACQ